ncbi:PREDICTED: uncharacterized protein LOC109343719 isoform X1 [Lupinus angustifolius]|uniref:uncharacterized protein LOC109343719 isoform X1 n=1 Tax=Lupinus angustifolius TaxID=3871 RepID=UPI00092E7755|nr:PREDICTED: uncharacterized protein LOC109343719 isoform X1 [Lupinus angustifolius]
MRFVKGSNVEVLANTKELCVEWRCARIVSSNRHTCAVQYDGSRITNEAGVERVPRKAIRPCPPLVKGTKRWEANDVMEVYDDGSWTAAIVLKFLGGDFYLVRLFISCKELEVHKANTRIRQSWQNGEWVVKPTVSGNSGVGRSNWSLISNSCKVMPEVQHASIEISQQGSNDCALWEPRPALSTTLKRVSPYCSSPVEAYPRKIRVVMNKGGCERFKAVYTAPLMGKVDAFAYPQNDMGEKCMLASFTNGSNQYHLTGKENHSIVKTQFLERVEEPDYSCSDMSSVGSCSVISNNTNKFYSDMLAGPCQEGDALSSDAESLDTARDNGCPISPREVIAERIHRLELHAYRSTLEVMYASSCLSWEQEELLTDLRISLHISNDEHSMELKKLVSACPHL